MCVQRCVRRYLRLVRWREGYTTGDLYRFFSPPPPRGATFDVPPGGVAILAKKPLVLKHVPVPTLHRWESMGRLTVARLIMGDYNIMIVAMYAYPPSHEDRASNEELYAQAFAWARGLRDPVLIAGDYNQGVHSSPILSLADVNGIYRISPELATTRSKKGGPSGNCAIDHAYCNHAFLDLSPLVQVDHTRWLSDHYPLTLTMKRMDRQVMSWRWPKPMKWSRTLEPPPREWMCEPKTYTEWAQYTVQWLSEKHVCAPQSKLHVHTDMLESDSKRVDIRYMRILAAQKCLAKAQSLHPTPPELVAKLVRQFKALGLAYSAVWEEDTQVLHSALTHVLDELQGEALKKWRAKAHSWHSQAPELYRYLKNNPPSKCVALVNESGEWTSHPTGVFHELDKFWSAVESWPSEQARLHALNCVEDVYSVFLPTRPCSYHIQPKDLMKKARSMKESAPGPDAWTKAELKSLPVAAWKSLLDVCGSDSDIHKTSLFWFRRVPIEKDNDGAPRAQDYRPIDVFSKITRCMASVHTDNMREWTSHVLLPTQYASKGGIETATAVMNTYAERVLGRLGHCWCVSIDFGKLFNTISPEVVFATVSLMGLDQNCAIDALRPLQHARGIWRLPQNGICPWRKYARGLPQGMSTSVTFSEVFLSLLLWRVKYIVPSVSISYVDDLTFQTDTRDRLTVILRLVWAFVSDFSLNLSLAKTSVGNAYCTSQTSCDRLGNQI